MSYAQFKDLVKEAVDEFRKIPKTATVRVVSHLDCDGICAVSLMIKALMEDHRVYALSIIQQLNLEVLHELAKEEHEYVIFTDLGSGVVDQIARVLAHKKVFVFDHHELASPAAYPNIVHVNPHRVGINGSKEISGAGVTYMFVKEYNPKLEPLAYLAIIGALGDIQDSEGFLPLNQEILKLAEIHGTMEVRKGLRFFGVHTRPIHKALEYCNDPFIPGVTGSESAAIQFLQDLNIPPKQGKEWRTFSDLTEDERKRLALHIIMRRHKEKLPDDVFGDIYVLPQETTYPQFKDAKEFSTVLNACGRLQKASVGIGACLNDPVFKKKAVTALLQYRREIVDALKWYRENQNTFIRGERYLIINAESNVLPTMIGTMASILAKSGELPEYTYILSMARSANKSTKVSLRIACMQAPEHVDLHGLIMRIVSRVGGESGGHANAAGAIIPTEFEQKFIEQAKAVLSQAALEEQIS